MTTVCITVDLDEIGCYHAIHGLTPPAGEMARAVHDRALPRLAQMFERLGVKATFFAVGRDLAASDGAVALLRQLADRGHEVANHTQTHPYDLTARDPADQTREIDHGAEAITRLVGRAPRGFRAPGYNVHTGITDHLARRGYAYDSSVFPCPLYFSTRAAAISLAAATGRRSASLVGDPRVLTAPTGPYRIGDDGVWSRGDGLLELPITVAGPLRLPMLGTSLSLMGRVPASMLARAAARLPFVNVELHGIDLLDADGDGLGHLVPYQPDLRVPLTRKRQIIERVIRLLLGAGLRPMTLLDAASGVLI